MARSPHQLVAIAGSILALLLASVGCDGTSESRKIFDLRLEAADGHSLLAYTRLDQRTSKSGDSCIMSCDYEIDATVSVVEAGLVSHGDFRFVDKRVLQRRDDSWVAGEVHDVMFDGVDAHVFHGRVEPAISTLDGDSFDVTDNVCTGSFVRRADDSWLLATRSELAGALAGAVTPVTLRHLDSNGEKRSEATLDAMRLPETPRCGEDRIEVLTDGDSTIVLAQGGGYRDLYAYRGNVTGAGESSDGFARGSVLAATATSRGLRVVSQRDERAWILDGTDPETAVTTFVDEPLGGCWAATFDASGNAYIMRADNETVLYAESNGELVRHLVRSEGSVSSCALSHDGTRLHIVVADAIDERVLYYTRATGEDAMLRAELDLMTEDILPD